MIDMEHKVVRIGVKKTKIAFVIRGDGETS